MPIRTEKTAKICCCRAAVRATTPISHESVNDKRHYLQLIEAAASVRTAVRRFAESCREAVSANGVEISDVDLFVPHQANSRIIQGVAKNLKVAEEKFYMTIHKYGNSSSASCAAALDEAIRSGAVRPNDMVCLTTFGGGAYLGRCVDSVVAD